jgi:hypothetical protein
MEVTLIKQNQTLVDNAIPTAVAFVANAPFMIAGTGSFDLLAWNGVAYAVVDTVIIPSFVASAGKYALTAIGAVTITASPRGRA